MRLQVKRAVSSNEAGRFADNAEKSDQKSELCDRNEALQCLDLRHGTLRSYFIREDGY